MQRLEYDKELVLKHLGDPVFGIVGEVADGMGRECYVVGGYVRDMFLGRASKDIDFVTVGSGIEVAEGVQRRLGKRATLAVFRNFGTAQVKWQGGELEFVGARRESYTRDSRKPIVEDGTLDDDQRRRDFTINAMAVCVNHARFGELLDPFGGMDDLHDGIIRTPMDPDITFSDDPLRMMRAIRFATQLGFEIYPETFAAIERNRERIGIISHERIADELMKIMKSARPSLGFVLLDRCRLLEIIFPELAALKGVETMNGRGHKDNFLHTMQVLDNVAASSDNVWLRWAALLHDIAKPATKRYDAKLGWTFHNHNFVGEKMVPRIFKRMRLPMNEKMKYVAKLVGLHMRPIALVEEVVTDSAVRRLLFDAGDDIDDLMALCAADITSKNREKVRRIKENYELVRRKLVELEEKDRIRNFQPPVTGEEIMATFGLKPCSEVGKIKEAIKNAILDGKVANDHAAAHQFMLDTAAGMGLKPVKHVEVPAQMPVGSVAREIYHSPIGDMVLVSDGVGLSECRFADEDGVSSGTLGGGDAITHLAAKQLAEYFAGARRDFTVPLSMHGTDFQQQVWRQLTKITYGTYMTYSQLAAAIGNPRASRAVGNANGRNPVAVIVPCHRVLAAGCHLGGYSAGLDRKEYLLKLESITFK